MRTTWIMARSLGAGLVLAAMVAAGSAMAAEAPQLADPQPAAAEGKPGLAVRYYKSFFLLIEEFVEWQTADKASVRLFHKLHHGARARWAADLRLDCVSFGYHAALPAS